MKKHILLIAMLVASCVSIPAMAQLHVQVNIGLQPVWGPVGYDYVQYYYIPDMDVYYDVANRHYVYYDNDRWIMAGNLPSRYGRYDIYNVHKVVINEPSPWMHNDRYRTQYVQYKGRHDQKWIRDSREERYYENPGHPNHNQWKGNQGRNENNRQQGNGHDNGRGNERNNGHGNERDNGHGNERNNDHGNGHGEGHGNEHGEGHGNGHR